MQYMVLLASYKIVTMAHLVKYDSCVSGHYLSLLTNVSLMKPFLPLASLTLGFLQPQRPIFNFIGIFGLFSQTC